LDNSPILNNFNHEHINYFSVKSADWLFGRCGFTRIEKHISICFNHNDNLQFSNIVLYKINLNNSQKILKMKQLLKVLMNMYQEFKIGN
jgi:hypothetical protein